MKYLSVLFVFSVSFIILTINGKYLPDFVHRLNSKGWDKLAHTLIFLAIELTCFYLLYPIINYHPSPRITFLILFLLGIFLEFIQLLNGREFSYLDMLANGLGIILGILINNEL